MRYLAPLLVCLLAAPAWAATAPVNLAFAPSAPGKLPSGWDLMVTPPKAAKSYQAGTGATDAHQGEVGAFIQSHGKPPSGTYGALEQAIDATQYRGKRVRFSCWLRPASVAKRAGLFLFADDAKGMPMVGDNTEDRYLKGTGAWRELVIVQDVPKTAAKLRFGAVLFGEGRLSIAEATFSPVGNTVTLTPNVLRKGR